MYNCGKLWTVTVKNKETGAIEYHSYPTLADAQAKAYEERLAGNNAIINHEEW